MLEFLPYLAGILFGGRLGELRPVDRSVSGRGGLMRRPWAGYAVLIALTLLALFTAVQQRPAAATTTTVTPSDGGAGGTFTPTTVALAADSSTDTKTFTYTPTSDGTVTISVTNNRSLTNPSSIQYTSPLKGGTAEMLLLHLL